MTNQFSFPQDALSGFTDKSENALHIHLHESEPENSRNALIGALAAAMRWHSGYEEPNYIGDDFNRHILSELLSALSRVKE